MASRSWLCLLRFNFDPSWVFSILVPFSVHFIDHMHYTPLLTSSISLLILVRLGRFHFILDFSFSLLVLDLFITFGSFFLCMKQVDDAATKDSPNGQIWTLRQVK
jgi:hypothetical protein